MVSTSPYAMFTAGRGSSLADRFSPGVMEYITIAISGKRIHRDVAVPQEPLSKDGVITHLSSIRPGDNVHMVSNSASHDGIIIIVE